MAYSRREVQDHVTIMNKDLYDNLQDGIEQFGVTPQMFGAVGDGIHNDTQAFIAMFNSDNLNIFIPKGTYLITPNKGILMHYSNSIDPTGIWIHNSNTTVIFDKGAKLVADIVDQNTFTFYSMIWIGGRGYDKKSGLEDRVENVVVRGAVIEGARSQYESTSSMENGLGIAVVYGNNVTVEDCCITDNIGDSIFTYAVGNITIKNCVSRRSRRGAISIGSCDGFVVDGCDFAEEVQRVTYPNGNFSDAKAPFAIICIENDSYGAATGTNPRNILIQNCTLMQKILSTLF